MAEMAVEGDRVCQMVEMGVCVQHGDVGGDGAVEHALGGLDDALDGTIQVVGKVDDGQMGA